MKLFDTTLGNLQSSLNIRLAKQTVLAGNLANVDTPGFRPRELDFDAAFKASQAGNALSAGQPTMTHEGHLGVSAEQTSTAPEAFVKVSEKAEGGLDGNAVDLDRTMVELSRNALQYGAAARAAGKKLAILKYVASDGVG